MNKFLRKLYNRIDTDLHKCKFCGKEIKISKSTLWNLRKHISSKHPSSYAELMKYFDRNSSDNTKRTTKEMQNMPKPRPGWIRKYCERVKQGLYRCNLCTREIRMSDELYGNMKRHVKNLHPRAYQEELRLNKDGDENIVHNEVVEYVVEYVASNNLEKIKSTNNDFADEGSRDEDIDKTACLEEAESLQKLQTNPEATQSSDDEPLLSKKEKNSVEKVVIELISLKDPDLESKIKSLCEKPIPGRRK